MATGKKSFVLYSDQRSIIDMLPDDKAGILLKHIFAYVNDENPINKDPLILLAFEPIKLQMKRDLIKWESTKEGRSAAGKASAEARRLAKEIQQNSTNSTNVNFVQQSSTNSTVNVNDTVTVNVNDTVTVKKENNIDSRKLKFANTLKPFLNIYGKELLNEFYLYWIEPNKSNTKMRFEMQKTWSVELRLRKWAMNDKNFNQNKNGNNQPITADERVKNYTEHVLESIRKQVDSQEPIKGNENSTDDFATFTEM